jgi:hypothetical protein
MPVIKRVDIEGYTGNEDSQELQKMLTSCMINRQLLVRCVLEIEYATKTLIRITCRVVLLVS